MTAGELFPPGPVEVIPLNTTGAKGPLVWHIPGSKSITNRALPLAAPSRGRDDPHGGAPTLTTRCTCAVPALEAMGVLIEDVDATTLRAWRQEPPACTGKSRSSSATRARRFAFDGTGSTGAWTGDPRG